MQLKLWKASAIPADWIESRKKMNWGITEELEDHVKTIIYQVRKRGDAALAEYTKKFDDASLDPAGLRVTPEEIKAAYDAVTNEQLSALKLMKKKLETIEKHALSQTCVLMENDGVTVRSCSSPIRSVGCYVPGGSAAYPSTLIMTVTPAKVAGVPRVVVCSPPTSSCEINPLTLVAADICNVDEIYRVGGPQAISALAYGTESIKPVKKIVGPGNRYVTTAKVLVSRDVAIDMPAGPSEILVLADKTADPKIVALDMISQAEHGVDSVSGLITTSKDLAKKVAKRLEATASSVPREKIVAESLSSHGFVIIFKTLDQMIRFANDFAPEHIEVITKDSMEVAKKVTSAGLVLVGPYTPVSASDYCLGTNHVLPTSGFGQIYSGLSVHDFIRRVNIVECSKDGLKKIKENVKILAESENLPNHYLAVKGRLNLEETK